MKRKRLICLVLLYAIFSQFFISPARAQNETTTPSELKKGLRFRLREDARQAPQKVAAATPEVSKITAAEADAIIRRLPAMDETPADQTDFSLRAASLPPPKTGRVIPVKFPAAEDLDPPAAPDAPQNAVPLGVMRFAPNGGASLVKDLSVSFTQPMIAVSSQRTAAETVPVRLAPDVPGKWRWRGTNTLIFDAEPRFPMATRFTATIPAGTQSATGSRLPEDFTWIFETPPATIESFLPARDENVRRDAVMLATFNQKIDAEAILPKIGVTANGQKFAVRRAAPAEIAADKKISEAVKNLAPDRWIAFRAVDPLPADSPLVVSFDAGLPSAEGDLKSISPQNFSLRTFGSLRLVKTTCGYSSVQKAECETYEGLKIEFSNPLDAASFDKSLVKIEPAIENVQIAIAGKELHISGCCRESRKTYKVTVSENLRDVFGQTPDKKVTAKFKIAADVPEISFEQPGLYYENGQRDFITLDPAARRHSFAVRSVNYPKLRVRIYKAAPEDYEAFYRFKQNSANQTAPAPLPEIGALVYEKAIRVKSKRGADAATRIDLAPALVNGVGHAILAVEPLAVTEENREHRVYLWLEATRIGVDAFADYERLTIFASDLKTGKPLPNVALQTSKGAAGATDENGLGTIEMPAENQDKGDWLIARRGADSAILLENNDYSSNRKWSREYPAEMLRWFVFDDRKMYRPGETVSIKGYVRKFTGGKISELDELGDAAKTLNYVLQDPSGREIIKGKAAINGFGAFDFKLPLPEYLNLGSQLLSLSTDSEFEGKDSSHRFEVQEFRRPEFEVTAKNETRAPYYVGDSARVSVEAKYYAGGALANAATNWTVTARPTAYTPPNRDDFTFGTFVPWWRSDYRSDYAERTTEKYESVTDAGGKHFLALDFVSANPSRPYTITAEARVADVNRQTFAASTNLLVHPAELYVGIRAAKNFVAENERFRVETITTDVDGSAVAGAPVTLVGELKDWEQIKGEWREVTVDRQSCEIRSTSAAAACEFYAKQGGTFHFKATVADKKERRSESELTVWVAGAKSEPSREIEKETVELIPGKAVYAPGETAEILVNAPFFPAEGVLTVRRGGIVSAERFTMNEASTVLKIPVEEKYVPNFHAQVDLVGVVPRVVFESELDAKLPKRPAYASGALNFNVSLRSRELRVAAEPLAKTLEPGGETSISVAVTDHDGRAAANTEVTLVAVDESVLALTNYRIADPVAAFYPPVDAGANDYYARENILLADPFDLLSPEDTRGRGFGFGNGSGSGSGSGYGDGDGSAPTLKRSVFSNLEIITSMQRPPSKVKDEIRIRRNFDALAIFAPQVVTDADGKAVVTIKLPDNLTRYRITAIAATKSKQFGKTESTITARQSLMVRPSAPRFMNFGDRAELPVVLQNQTDKSLTVDVALRAANAVLTDGSGRRVTIPANDRAELRFLIAPDSAGLARFQVGAVAGDLADAAEFAFPVYTPATTEAFATYGTTEQPGAIVQPVAAPDDVFPQFGGLEITTSSTQLQELTDAFLYLQSYPFECSEQVSSRILSVAALRDVLQAFNAKELPTTEQIEAKMTADIEHLRKLQHPDGGFSFWSSKDESLPFVTVHVGHALARAKAKGYRVPPALMQNLLNYLRGIEAKLPESYGPETRRAIAAYALYVRGLMNDKDAAKARQLWQESATNKTSAETLGWLLAVLAGDKDSGAQRAEISRILLNSVTETAGAANFTTSYKDGEHILLASDRRTDGVVLEALLKADPQNPLIPKIVRGLLASRTKGRWRNTQENAFVLLALDKYFEVYEKVMPDFAARVWLGQTYAGEQRFTGRGTESKMISVPMKYLKDAAAPQNLVLEKQGAGRLYYRIGMKYAPRNLRAGAADFGFTVTRAYEALDDPADVRQDAAGAWTIRSGARVRVRLQMVAPARRYHVALVDHLPAGLEIVNSNLAVSESTPPDENMSSNGAFYPFDEYRWFEHQNLRDSRAEVFQSQLRAGVWNYSYIARATTPGDFVVPPAKAEEMYSPEVFGRTGTDFVNIK